MRRQEVSLISNQELEVSNWRNLVCSSSVPDFLARNHYFLARNGHFLARKYTEQRREQKSREQYSRVEQTRAEKKRVDITVENSRAEQN